MVQAGDTGLFVSSVPYVNTISTAQVYTCVKVERLSEILLSGDDAFTAIFSDVGVSAEEYDQHVKDDIVIAVMKTPEGNIVRLPLLNIAPAPAPEYVMYVEKALVLNIGSFPTDVPVNLLLDELKRVVKSTLGVDAEALVMDVSPIQPIPKDDHVVIADVRSVKIPVNDNTGIDVSSDQVLLNNLDAARQKVTLLEKFISNCNCKCIGRDDAGGTDEPTPEIVLSAIVKRNIIIRRIVDAKLACKPMKKVTPITYYLRKSC